MNDRIFVPTLPVNVKREIKTTHGRDYEIKCLSQFFQAFAQLLIGRYQLSLLV